MSVATSTLLGRPLWYELMTTDMKAAEAFYRDVVGWKTAPFEGAGQPYTMFTRTADTSTSVGGGCCAAPSPCRSPAWSSCRSWRRPAERSVGRTPPGATVTAECS